MKGSPDFVFVPAMALTDKALENSQLRTFALICMHINRKQTGSFPSYATLAEEQGIDRRNIIKNVGKLCDLGYLRKEVRERPNGSASSNFYHLNFDFSTDLGGSGLSVTTPSGVDVTTQCTGRHPLYNNQTNKVKNTNSKKVSLGEWEDKNQALLNCSHVEKWAIENNLQTQAVRELIFEFREKVSAGGNKYADFPAAFKVWLRSGYLSRKIENIRIPSPSSPATAYVEKGLSL